MRLCSIDTNARGTCSAAAEEYIQNAKRTWAIWIGIGDYETQTFDLVGYTQESATVYTDVTAPDMTGQPYLQSVAYVDKHPQVCCRTINMCRFSIVCVVV